MDTIPPVCPHCHKIVPTEAQTRDWAEFADANHKIDYGEFSDPTPWPSLWCDGCCTICGATGESYCIHSQEAEMNTLSSY